MKFYHRKNLVGAIAAASMSLALIYGPMVCNAAQVYPPGPTIVDVPPGPGITANTQAYPPGPTIVDVPPGPSAQ